MQKKLHEILNLSLPHFSTISTNIALLQLPNEKLYLVPRGVNSSNKKWSEPFVACLPHPHMITLGPPLNLYVPPSPINMTNIRQNTKFPLPPVPLDKPVYQAFLLELQNHITKNIKHLTW